jgi:hypothetical protein
VKGSAQELSPGAPRPFRVSARNQPTCWWWFQYQPASLRFIDTQSPVTR